MNRRRKYYTQIAIVLGLSLLGVLLVMPAKAMENNKLVRQDDPYRTELFNLTKPGQLDVKTSGGYITVEGSSSNRVRVEMYVRKDGKNLLPEDTSLDDWEISIEKSGDKIQAIAKHEGSDGWKFFSWGKNTSVSFVVHTPQKMMTKLKTSGGQIKTKGITGDQSLSTSGGRLELADLEGTLEAQTSGGNINISNIKGDLKAKTSGGHISLKNSEGSLAVKTSGGSIDLDAIKGTVSASTSGGNISADLLSIKNHVKLRTSGGNIHIKVPAKVGLDLSLHGSYVKTNLQGFSGEIDKDKVKGKLKGGGPELSAQTSGGTVQLGFN